MKTIEKMDKMELTNAIQAHGKEFTKAEFKVMMRLPKAKLLTKLSQLRKAIILEVTTPANVTEIPKHHDTGESLDAYEQRDVIEEEDLNDDKYAYEPEAEHDPIYTVYGKIGWFQKNSRFINGFLNNVPVIDEDGDRDQESIKFTYMATDALDAFSKKREYKKMKSSIVEMQFTKKHETWIDKNTGLERSGTKALITSMRPVGEFGNPIEVSLLGYDIFA